MADETNLSGTGSNNAANRNPSVSPATTPSAQSAPSSIPEPVILEETIIKPAPLEATPLTGQAPLKTPSAPTQAPAPQPVPSIAPKINPVRAVTVPPPDFPKPPAQPIPVSPPQAPSRVPALEIGSFVPPELQKSVQPPPAPAAASLSTPSQLEAAPAPPTLQTLAPSISIPAKPLAAPMPAAPAVPPRPAAPVPTSEPVAQKQQAEIEKILESTKLPERHEVARPVLAPKVEQHMFDTSLGATLSEDNKLAAPIEPIAAMAPAEGPKSQSLASSIVAPLRTLKQDLQNIIRTRKISLVRAAALEQEKQRGSEAAARESDAPRSHRGRAFVFAAALLFILGAAAIFGVYVIEQQRAAPVANTGIPQSSILFSENTVAFPLQNQSPLDLKRLLAQARTSSNATLGSITRIVPTVRDIAAGGPDRSATTQEFLTALGVHAPPDLLRALASDFFFGIHTVDKNAPIFIIPVTSYEQAFAGMLAWENNMNADLAPVFTAVPDQVMGPGGLPQKRQFDDLVMRNYDVRALKDDSGAIELYYSFPTQNLLVIGESPYSFSEVLSRLRAQRKL